MKVVVTGANSAVGQAILRYRATAAPEMACLAVVRSQRAAEQIKPLLANGNAMALVSYDDAESLDAALRGASAVIHLPGVLMETRNSTYEQANVASTRSVVESAKRMGVQKFVLVSATGASEASANRYYRTKGQAEVLARQSGLNYTVLRAPLLLGPHTAGAAALKRNVSRSRTKLIGGGRHLQQPLYVDDLAQAAVIAALTPPVAKNLTLDLVGPVPLEERELVERAARLLGRKIRIGSIPKSLIALVLAIRQRLGKTGFSRDVLEVITDDTRLDPQPAAKELGLQLTGLDEMIRASLNEGSGHE